VDDDLEKVRAEIDDTDSEILRFLNRRMELALRIGRIKASKGMPLFHPEREQIVFQHILNRNQGPLSEELLRSIYREIFAASRLIQYRPEEDRTRKAQSAGPSICGCFGECSSSEFLKYINHPEIDMVEWRMDMLPGAQSPETMGPFLAALSSKPRLPLIATNRPVREMGGFSGDENLRIRMLEEAAKAGAEWVDVEHDADLDCIERLHQAGARVLLSWHCSGETPSQDLLLAKFEKMRSSGADALKIVTMAQNSNDNLRILELIPLAKEHRIDLVAFCMGPAGKWSRVASLFLGSPWTYAQFEGLMPTATGQLLISEVRALIRAFGTN
jgi:3-dehydroquinate dehydratase-1